MIANAVSAVAKQDWRAALVALLAAWRKTPAPEIADAIEAISARASAGMEAPTAATARGRNDAWNALAKVGDPIAMGMLCATAAATKGNVETLGRLELLLPHGPDPRLSSVICGWIEKPPYNVTVHRTQKFWKRVWPLLAQLGDPRILTRSADLAAVWARARSLNPPERVLLAKRLVQHLPALTAAYSGTVHLSDADRAACAKLAGASAAPLRTTAVREAEKTDAELLAAIYAAPDDDAPRIVYGDSLGERGDPRGEFIALQIAKATAKLTKEQAAREKALTAEFGGKWIAPLTMKKTGVKFDRGFVASGTPSDFREGPAWATVRRFDAVDSATVRKLATATQPLALRELEWDAPGVGDPHDGPAARVLAKIATLPRLRRLELMAGYIDGYMHEDLGVKHLAWLFRSPLAKQLEELRVMIRPHNVPAIIAAFAKLPLRRLETCDRALARNPGWQTIVERDAAGALAKLTIVVSTSRTERSRTVEWGSPMLAWLEAAPITLFSAATIVTSPTTSRLFGPLRKRLVAALERQTRVERVAFA